VEVEARKDLSPKVMKYQGKKLSLRTKRIKKGKATLAGKRWRDKESQGRSSSFE